MSLDVAAAADVEAAEPSASQALQDEALAQVDITGHPTLRPVGTYRMRQRVELLAAVQSLGARFERQDGEQAGGLDGDQLLALAEIDELLERICVVDPDAYSLWATGDGGPDVEGRVLALFSKVAEDLGKSMGSAS